MRVSTTTAQVIVLLVLGVALRFTGLTWGIPVLLPDIDAFFCDETWMMEAFAQMNPAISDFSPDMGYREGSLSYFIITAVFLLLKSVNLISGLPHEVILHSYDYGVLILIGRAVVATFDLISILTVFFTLKLICKTSWAPFAGAFSLTIFPFEVIYSHYLRAHIIGNTFLVLVIYFTFRSYLFNRSKNLLLASIAVGLAAATRYTLISSVIFPISAVLFNSLRANFRATTSALLNQRILYLIIIAVLMGFLIGSPHVLTNFQVVKQNLLYQSTFAEPSEFTIGQLLNLSRLKIYITKLIPDGTGPILWVLFYASILYLPIRPKLYKYTLSLLIFVFSFGYLMGKGYYSSATFVRTMLPIFPIFSLCLGIVIDDLITKFRNNKYANIVIYSLYAIFIIPSFLFSAGYVYSMGYKVDPRVAVALQIKQLQVQTSSKFRIALVGPAIPYTFPTLVVDKIASPRSINLYYNIKDVKIEWRDTFDYIILSATDHEEDIQIEMLLEDSEISKNFELVEKFKNEISFLGVKFDYTGIAHDMSYPFSRIYLLKPKSRLPVGD